MTNEDSPPDYGELLRSPYDESDSEGSHQRDDPGSDAEIPWKPAVVAAALGALLVGAFVIYAIVVSPDVPNGAIPTESVVSTTQAPEPVQSSAFPDGFTPLTESVAARVEAVAISSLTTAFGVNTAVRGGLDPAEVPPLDVAYWELVYQDASALMTAQYPLRGALGSLTVEFPPLETVAGSALVPYIEDGSVEDTTTVELDVDVPATIESFTIELGGERFVEIDSLVVGDGWGHVAWSSRGGPARVETVVRFAGTDDPSTPETTDETLLTPAHLRPLTQGSGVIPLAPLYGFSGSEQLVRSGEPLGTGNQPDAIVVEFRVVVPRDVVKGSEIVVPSG